MLNTTNIKTGSDNPTHKPPSLVGDQEKRNQSG